MLHVTCNVPGTCIIKLLFFHTHPTVPRHDLRAGASSAAAASSATCENVSAEFDSAAGSSCAPFVSSGAT